MSEECQHTTVVGEDAGFEVGGVRQVIAVCHLCGMAGPPADSTLEAIELFMQRYPKEE